MTYIRTVGSVDDKASVMIVPLADQVNTSICPGVSTRIKLHNEIRKRTIQLVVSGSFLQKVQYLIKSSCK